MSDYEKGQRDMQERAAAKVQPNYPRGCDCEYCDCGNRGDSDRVAKWDADTTSAGLIRALPITPAEQDEPVGEMLANYGAVMHKLLPAGTKLYARPADDARDAARYRWLRDQFIQTKAYDRFGNGGHWSGGFFSSDSNLSFDAAIDAAKGGE